MKLVSLNNPVDVITNIPNKVAEIGSKVSDLKDGTIEAIEIIGKLSKMIINAIDYVGTVILNPDIMLTFIDEMTIVIIIFNFCGINFFSAIKNSLLKVNDLSIVFA